ncbi:MAG: CvpA family protein [Bryobacteraceae bacterium]|jgi:membrane protein required for colicin V production
MNWLDIVILVIVAWSVAIAFRKGLVREVLGLASVILALFLGLWFYGTAAAWLAPYLSSRPLANAAGFLVVFIGVLLIGAVASYIIGKFLRVTGLSIVDHALGAAFGVVRGILIAIALVMAIMAFSKDGQPPESIVQSRTAPFVAGAARLFAAMAPYEMKEGFRKTYDQAGNAWKKALELRLQSVPKAQKEQ